MINVEKMKSNNDDNIHNIFEQLWKENNILLDIFQQKIKATNPNP